MDYLNLPDAPPSDVDQSAVMQGGIIVAKEGQRRLVHSEDTER
jgi:hypothetical protein